MTLMDDDQYLLCPRRHEGETAEEYRERQRIAKLATARYRRGHKRRDKRLYRVVIE